MLLVFLLDRRYWSSLSYPINLMDYTSKIYPTLVLGALILMPIGLGMINLIFVIGQTQWLSLMGHVIYSLITAYVFIPLAKRA